jgi:hypothetical protein
MGQKILVNGVERELVRVACPVVKGNDQGFYLSYRDLMREDEVEYDSEAKPKADAVAVAQAQEAAQAAVVTETQTGVVAKPAGKRR